MVNFKKTIIFQGSRGGPTFSRGVQFFPGGSNCLFPIETHITCDFPGGGGPDPLSPPPLDPHLNPLSTVSGSGENCLLMWRTFVYFLGCLEHKIFLFNRQFWFLQSMQHILLAVLLPSQTKQPSKCQICGGGVFGFSEK